MSQFDLSKEQLVLLKCPQCQSTAARPNCLFDLGGYCPRNDSENYDEDELARVNRELAQKRAIAWIADNSHLLTGADRDEALISAVAGLLQKSDDLEAIVRSINGISQGAISRLES